MRLYKKHAIEEATDELLAILREHPEGVRTSDLSGTPKFHGGRSLDNRQIIRLLKASGKAEMRYGGNARFSYGVWRLKERGAPAPRRVWVFIPAKPTRAPTA